MCIGERRGFGLGAHGVVADEPGDRVRFVPMNRAEEILGLPSQFDGGRLRQPRKPRHNPHHPLHDRQLRPVLELMLLSAEKHLEATH